MLDNNSIWPSMVGPGCCSCSSQERPPVVPMPCRRHTALFPSLPVWKESRDTAAALSDLRLKSFSLSDVAS